MIGLKAVRKGDLEYLVADHFSAPHCFTTRYGGVSEGYLSSMNLGMHRGDKPENVEENYRILSKNIGFSLETLVLTRQIHSDIVRKVGKADANGLDNHEYPACDALITKEPGVALAVFSADCTPILLEDPVTGAVGALHAGWRGTAAALAEKTVQAMTREFGCKPENIRAAIGPNIGPCCFETDADVPDAMINSLGHLACPHIVQKHHKFHVNLKNLNAAFLRRAGVTQIRCAQECTACESERFWSHRVTGGRRGSQGAIIVCKEAAK